MKSTSESSKPGTHRKWKSYAAAAAAVAATAVVGARAVDADSAWYKALDKPQWQPPSWAFGVVWTPLYASVAWAMRPRAQPCPGLRAFPLGGRMWE